jgi:hypothetical protein
MLYNFQKVEPFLANLTLKFQKGFTICLHKILLQVLKSSELYPVFETVEKNAIDNWGVEKWEFSPLYYCFAKVFGE